MSLQPAEDYINWDDSDSDGWGATWKWDAIIKYINQARIDTINECANVVQQNYDLTVDKQSILKLIDEIK